jgi:hypothetical protein
VTAVIATELAPWMFVALCVAVRLRVRWRAEGYSWRAFVGDLGQALMRLGDRCSEYAAGDTAPIVTCIRVNLERKAPRLAAQLVGDHVVVAVPGRLVKFPARCAACGGPR